MYTYACQVSELKDNLVPYQRPTIATTKNANLKPLYLENAWFSDIRVSEYFSAFLIAFQRGI